MLAQSLAQLSLEVQAYDAFRHYWRTYFLGDPQPEKRLIAIFVMDEFSAYFDESYGNDSDAYAVAGYIATVDQWTQLVREFRELGEQEGYTVLHKRLLEHNIPGSEFEWPSLSRTEKAEKKKRINKRACAIIKRRVNAGFAAIVTKSVWEREVANTRWGEGWLGKSFYAAGVFQCLNMAQYWATQYSRKGYFRYVFEEGAMGQKEARRLLEKVKTNDIDRETFHMGGYSFERKEDPEFVPLQAADFLAYETYRQADNRVMQGIKLNKDGKEIDVRGALKCLLYWGERVPAVESTHLPTPLYAAYLNERSVAGLLELLNERWPFHGAV